METLSHAADFGIDTYKGLKKAVKESGVSAQVHHIIEQRFAERLGLGGAREMLSVVLTAEEHRAFTNAWRKAIRYANDNADIITSNATRDDVWMAAQRIYADYPDLLEAAKKTLQ